MTESICIRTLEQAITLTCDDPAFRNILSMDFGAMMSDRDCEECHLNYHIEHVDDDTALALARDSEELVIADDQSYLLHVLEQDILIELQKRRAKLLFFHAAALEWQGRTIMLAAESGGGKSTTTFALLHHGFRYLSDELSPIDLGDLSVHPFPRALCLKRRPPHYKLPDGTVDLGATIHIPTDSLPAETRKNPFPLGAVLLVKYSPEHSHPSMKMLSTAEATARLYTTALNSLAHDHRGLDAVSQVAEAVPCFTVAAADILETCDLIKTELQSVIVPPVC